MSRETNSYHQLQFKTYSKSQIPQAFFSTHLSPNIAFYDESIIGQITLEFSEKINNLQSQIDNLRMEFNAQIQSLNFKGIKEKNNAFKNPAKDKELSCCFDSINHNRNHKLNFNLHNTNIINKVKRSVLNNISNKSFSTKTRMVNYKNKLKISSNLKYNKNVRNRQNLLSYFSIRKEEKEKIKRMIIDANSVDRRSFDLPQIRKMDTERNTHNDVVLHSKLSRQANLSLHSIISNDNTYLSSQIKVISTIIIHNEMISFKDKIKLMYLNKEIKCNNDIPTLLNESNATIKNRIKDLSTQKRNTPFPSTNALNLLNSLTFSFDIYIKDQLKEINKDIAIAFFNVIYLLVSQSYDKNKRLNTDELYDNLMCSYNTKSIKELLINCIVNKINSSIDEYKIETKNTIVNIFKQHSILLSANTDSDLTPFRFISYFFDEINDMFINDIRRNTEIANLLKELQSFENILKRKHK